MYDKLEPGSGLGAAVEVRDLTKVYRTRKGEVVANDRLTLRIERGEVFGLLGPNGAGKTTLVLQLLGLLAPTAGRIHVEGVDVVARPERVKHLAGYMPQTRMAVRHVELQRALTIVARLRGLSDAAARRQAEEVIDRLDLGAYRDQFISRLSGGLMRVAALALAVIGEPRLLVLDEPTNELDPVRRRLVWQVLAELHRTRPVTCLVVTHNVLEAERVVGRVALVDRGRVVALDTPGGLKARLGQAVRLEVALKPKLGQQGASRGHREVARQRLASLGELVELRPGHFAVFLPRAAVGNAVESVLGELEGEVDDFRLAPPSLEDVYLHLVGQKLGDRGGRED